MLCRVYKGARLIQTLELSAQELTVGRDRKSDLVLRGGDVAPQHAKLQQLQGRWHVVNCDAASGLQVNGRSVSYAAISAGDRCAIGEYVLAFEEAGASPATPAAAPTPASPTPARDADGLLELLRETSRLAAVQDRLALLDRMLDGLIRHFRADRCSVLLPDAEGGFRPAVTRNLAADAVDRAISSTLIRRAVDGRVPVLLHDTLEEADLQRASSIAAANVRSAVCYPLVRDDRVVALLYLDSAGVGTAPSAGALDRLEAFATHALVILENLERRDELRRHVGQLQQMATDAVRAVHDSGSVVAQDPRSLEVMQKVQRVTGTEVSCLITGESGTGKELIARAIHDGSPRRAGPFIAVNCGAIPRDLMESELFGHEKGAFSGAVSDRPGRFELAHRGTIFLDELGELPLEAQVKLLRVLQERTVDRIGGRRSIPVDVRLIAATNANLVELVRRKEFREDLFYRVNVFHIGLPALRERPADVLPLARYFIAEFNRRMGRRVRDLDAAAAARLTAYRWPGNVRELRNVIERAFVLEDSDQLTAASLPFSDMLMMPEPAGGPELGVGPLDEAVAAFERAFIEAALARNGQNVTATAKSLGKGRQTLYDKLEELGIRPRR